MALILTVLFNCQGLPPYLHCCVLPDIQVTVTIADLLLLLKWWIFDFVMMQTIAGFSLLAHSCWFCQLKWQLWANRVYTNSCSYLIKLPWLHSLAENNVYICLVSQNKKKMLLYHTLCIIWSLHTPCCLESRKVSILKKWLKKIVFVF